MREAGHTLTEIEREFRMDASSFPHAICADSGARD